MSVAQVETLIDGTWQGTDEWLDVWNPADLRAPVAQVPALSPAQVAEIYRAATAGAKLWRATSPFDRAAVLRGAAALLRERAEEIAADVVAENGKTLAEARGEAGKAADFCEYYAGQAREPYGSLLHDARPNTRTQTQREPIGVVLAITPWNDPLLTPARKVAPALACGNSVVLKPATETPMSALHLARALHDAGLPAGVLNVVTGRTSQISDALLGDANIAAVTFTGSNEVGERLRQMLSTRNVRFQAELGGKNATVVLADADVDQAVAAIVAASFGQGGQRCTATSRVLVENSIYDRVVETLSARLSSITVGDGAETATTMGPMTSAGHRDSVLEAIERARSQGATVAFGGGAPSADALSHGCYVEPTVLTDISSEMDVWRQEVFGPVVVVRPVADLDEAIDAVNDSDFGLAAAIFTTQIGAAYRFIDAVDCGQVAVNTTTTGWDVHHPFGGFRDSGSAFKEQGEEALRFYTRVKVVAIHLPDAGQ